MAYQSVTIELLKARVKQHEDSLAGWNEPDGFLLPTEPDIDERRRIRWELRAVIGELNRIIEAAAQG
jgi:hypothetical protein